MNNLFKKLTASALALTTTAAYFPTAALVQAFAENEERIQIDNSLIALYAKNSIKLNEKSVNVNGGVFSGKELSYTGSSDNFSVSGLNGSANDGIECPLPDYTDFINSIEAYDFTYDKDTVLYDSVLDLTVNSVYSEGNLTIDHAELKASGRISAKGDITMSIAENDELQQTYIMSENGDITIDAANLDFAGVIYAPNGKVRINAKDISLIGAIYADSIEINGTSLTVEYRDLFKLTCSAHTTDTVYINRNESITLSGSVSNNSAEISYKLPASQSEYAEISGENTLSPVLSFSEPGEYSVTLTASSGNEFARDTVKIIVSSGPVANYTSTGDFNAGTLTSADGSNDELKLAAAKNDSAPAPKTYSLGGESGISVKSSQSKNSIDFGGDKLDLGFELEGYGQLITGNGNDVIIAIDNSGSVSSMIPTIKEAALQIIESMGPNDRLGITSLGRLNTPLTSDKDVLIEAFNKYNLDGSSNIGSGLQIAMTQMFDEESANRDKFIFLLADGENGVNSSDDTIALEMAAAAKENGTKIYSFEINPFSSSFNETQVMQQVAIDTNGAYKLCPNAEAISRFLLNMADNIYNLAARNVTFTTTVLNADWIKTGSMKKAPDSMVTNPDGSVTLSWNFNSFEIGAAEDLGISLNTGLITDKGFVQVTKDTKLISYNRNGEGSVLYIDDIIVGNDNFADNGKWISNVFDSGRENCQWTSVKWNADYYGNSAIDVYLSTSEDGVNFSDRIKVTNNQKELVLSGRYIRTEVEMKASDDGSSPVLYDLTVYSDTPDSSDLSEGVSAAIRGAHNVSAEAPVSLWLDISGKSDSVSDIKWDLGGGQELASDENPLRKTIVFPEKGEYTVKVFVTSGETVTETAVNISVASKASLIEDFEDEEEEFKAVKMEVPELPEYVTDYKTPLELNISFEDPEQVAWVRVLYHDSKNNTALQLAYVDEENDNHISVPIYSSNLSVTDITIEAYDWYGNKTAETRKTTLDRKTPYVTLNSRRSWVYPDNPITFTVTSSDENKLEKTALYCNGEEVELTAGEEDWTYIFSSRTPGKYVFMAEAIDVAGNRVETSKTVEVRADEGLPAAYINSNSSVILGNKLDIKTTAYDNETSLEKLILSVQKEGEENSTVIFDLDSSKDTIEKENTYTFIPDSTGTYIFTVTATDREGNTASASRKVTCRPDTSGPSISLKLSKSEILAGDFTDLTAVITDDVAVKDVKFFVDDQEAQLTEEGTFHYISDGSNVDSNGIKYVAFKVTAVDTAGNERSNSIRLKVITEDKTNPNVSISVSNRYEYLNANAYMTVSASDNIGVESLVVTVNGEAVTLDENGRYYFDTSKITEYTVIASAKDAAGNERSAERTVVISDTTRPAVKFTPDKNSYNQSESPVISVDVTDNYELKTVTADLDGTPVETQNGSFTCTISEAPAGQYVLTVHAEDIFGNVTDQKYTVKVRDTEAPVISVTADKETYAKSEIPDVSCEYSDNVGVTKVTANIDGTALTFDMETNKVVIPEALEAGDHTITVTARDAAGNTSEAASVSFFVSSSDDIISPVIEKVNVIPEIIRVGDEVTLAVTASDDSGKVKLTVTVNDTPVEESAAAGEFVFTPDAVGELKITIRAEDESGNYTQQEGTLNVFRNTENHKLVVEAPAVVKPGEAITALISVKDEIPFDTVELWLGEQNMSSLLTSAGDAKYQAQFSFDETGDYTLKAVGKDSDGYQTETFFTVQVSGTYETELESEEMQAALAQTSETRLNDELKKLAASFESPAEAYDYVYNNIDFEAYTNSRRGAAATYELKKGNDFDQASLLIGLLREMGYPARYAQGNVILTAEQTRSLMAMEDFEYAANMLASSGKNAALVTAADGSKLVNIEEAFVQVYVPASEIGETDEILKDLGVWVNLDTSIKPSEACGIEVTPSEQKTLNINEYKEQIAGTPYEALLTEFEAMAPQITEATGSTAIEEAFSGTVGYTSEADNSYGRQIITKNFTRLPSSLQYTLASDSLTAFNEVPIDKADNVQFVVQQGLGRKHLGTYKISDIYNKRVTLQFKGNTGGGTIFEMGKNAIYNNAFLPAMYVDGELTGEYSYDEYSDDLDEYMIDPDTEYYFLKNSSWRLGEKCKVTSAIYTNGRTSQWTDEVVIGSTYAMVFDTGGITESQYYGALNSAAENNGIDMSDPANPVPASDPEKTVNNTNYYDEAKIGSYLDFAGKYYFLYCDFYGTLNASRKDIEVGHDTKMLMTSYSVRSYEDGYNGYATTDIIPGRFQIDVSYNNGYTFSRIGDDEARNEYMFSTAYMESYYEGWLWRNLLNIEGASTGSILDKALSEGAEMLCINGANIEEMLAKADLTADETTEIRTAVENGLSVIVPDKRVAINEWSGTGYIVGDFVDYNSFTFKISGGMNGGSATEDIDLSHYTINTEQVFTTSFAVVQSLFYFMLEYSVMSEVMPAVGALSAASGCGPAAVFIGGMALYDAVKHLSDILGYRATMLDLLYNYCTSDSNQEEIEATVGMIELMVTMIKDLVSSLNPFKEESDTPILDGLKTLTQDLFDICAGDEFDDDTKDTVHDLTDEIWDIVGEDLDK